MTDRMILTNDSCPRIFHGVTQVSFPEHLVPPIRSVVGILRKLYYFYILKNLCEGEGVKVEYCLISHFLIFDQCFQIQWACHDYDELVDKSSQRFKHFAPTILRWKRPFHHDFRKVQKKSSISVVKFLKSNKPFNFESIKRIILNPKLKGQILQNKIWRFLDRVIFENHGYMRTRDQTSRSCQNWLRRARNISGPPLNQDFFSLSRGAHHFGLFWRGFWPL